MRVLVTGGTGTVGRLLVADLLRTEEVDYVRALGRSESRILTMRRDFAENTRLEVVPGDVSDADSMEMNCRGMDFVYHLAAMKHVDLVEQDPYLAMQTNITGTKVAVNAALRADVERVILMSTDKAVHASSLYGATKLVAEKVALAANRVRPFLNVVRCGNILNSSGSVLEAWRSSIARENAIRIMDPAMTRFFLTKETLLEFLQAARTGPTDVVVVPKCPAFRLADLADIIVEMYGDGKTSRTITGARAGEKRYEELVSAEELSRTDERRDAYHIGRMRRSTGLAAVPSSDNYVLPTPELRAIVDEELRRDGDLK